MSTKRQAFRRALDQFAKSARALDKAWGELPSDDIDTKSYPKNWGSFDEEVDKIMDWNNAEMRSSKQRNPSGSQGSSAKRRAMRG